MHRNQLRGWRRGSSGTGGDHATITAVGRGTLSTVISALPAHQEPTGERITYPFSLRQNMPDETTTWKDLQKILYHRSRPFQEDPAKHLDRFEKQALRSLRNHEPAR
ncbi:hypothetical protein HRR82_008114 [Exophiala dermatitidis]|nr:hypothetical protein HRR82_008114 [Exophiala dermatitidis]